MLKKLMLSVLLVIVSAFPAMALTQVPAKDIPTTTTNFNGNLSTADTTVQKALDTMDNMTNITGNAATATALQTSPTGCNAGYFPRGIDSRGDAQNCAALVPTSTTVNGHALSANVTVSKSDVGLGNADNTSDANKPISTLQQAGLDLKENTANKSTSTSLGTSNTLFPTQNAVKTYVDTGLGTKENTIGYTTENVANKSTNVSLGTSNTAYPSQLAVKTYVDTQVAAGAAGWISDGATKTTTNYNIGIGSSSPTQKLDVVGTVKATTFSGALSGNASTATALAANGANCSAGYAPLGVDASGAVEGCFSVTTAETDPIVKAITGIVKSNGSTISAASAGTDYLTPSGNGSALTATPFVHSGSVTSLYNTGDNVGIGSTAPTAKLEIVGTAKATAFSGPLTGNASTATALAANGTNCLSGQFPLGVDASGAVESCTFVADVEEDPIVAGINGLVMSNGTTISAAIAGTNYLAPNGSGSALTGLPFTHSGSVTYLTNTSDNVGIGSSSPRGKLDVDGTVYANGNIVANSVSTTGSSDSTVANNLFIPLGNVGIGTTTTDARLEVDGSAYFHGTLLVDNISTSGTTDSVVAQNLLLPNGNIGVGTSAPRGKIDVDGAIYAGTCWFDPTVDNQWHCS